MEETQDQELNNEHTPEDEEEYELSHTDKLIGVFTEPIRMFSKVSQFPPKVVDWIVPLLLLIIVASLSNVVLMTNPTLKYSIIEKQLEETERQLDGAVESGRMSQDQADTQLERTREFMETKGGLQIMISVVAILIFTFLLFFIISAVYLLMSKYLLKGEGTFSSSMVGYGLPYYILILQIIFVVILSLMFDRMFTSVSVAAFAEMDVKTFSGFLLSKVDPLSIWFYAIASIGLAKMFKSENIGKYFGMVFGLWIGFSIIFFFLAQQFAILQNFIR